MRVYLTRTQVVHTLYTLFAYFLRNQYFIAHFVNLRSVTTRVRVVYMFDKHVHVLNLLNINIITGIFMGRVRV